MNYSEDRIREASAANDDIRVDVIRAKEPWLSSVGVRITHVKTGITAECEDHRSQHMNMAVARERLRAALLEGASNE